MLDDAARYSILAAVLVIGIAGCVLGCFYLTDFFADKSGDDSRSQISALTDTENNRPRRKRVGDEGSETSSLLDDGAQIKSDKALMDTFVKVLSQGITVKMYALKDKAPKEVKLTLSGMTTLQWKATSSRSIMAAFKTNKMDIKQIKTVEWGKRTPVFAQPIAEQVSEDLCLSLVNEDKSKSLDFELSSKVERDSVAQGFSILVNTLNFDGSTQAPESTSEA
jgi:hypothetical protein